MVNLVEKNENALGTAGARRPRFTLGTIATTVVLTLAACGGGSGGGGTDTGDGSGTGDGGGTGTGTGPVTTVPTSTKPTAAEASRFLMQATMGPSEADINKLTGMSYGDWLDEQFAKPQTLHRLYINQAAADLSAVGQQLSNTNFWDSWWSQALAGEDQMRQRAAFALSEVMVISFADATVRNQTRGAASYYDMLGEKAFGNFRDLLEGVTYHPMMGIYLSHLKNQKEDVATGRVPDLNFAREITQLFAVGQYKLNLDGSNQMGTDGRPAVAYKPAGPRRPLAGLHRPVVVRRPGADRPHRATASWATTPTSSATGVRCRRTTSTRPAPATTRSARSRSSAR